MKRKLHASFKDNTCTAVCYPFQVKTFTMTLRYNLARCYFQQLGGFKCADIECLDFIENGTPFDITVFFSRVEL